MAMLSDIDEFQSTRPLRGATLSALESFTPSRYFNPRAPCGARPQWQYQRLIEMGFQSTRPLRGATPALQAVMRAGMEFQSTRPLRGATWRDGRCCYYVDYFNPRAPCGARRSCGAQLPPFQMHFNPRAPCGARRDGNLHKSHVLCISIHAPLAGRDLH